MSIESDKRIPEGIEGRGTKTGSEGQHAQGKQSQDPDLQDQAKRNSDLFKDVAVPPSTGSALSETEQKNRNRALWT
jgi:hypothetical protein